MIRPHCCFRRTNRCKFQCCQGYWWEYYIGRDELTKLIWGETNYNCHRLRMSEPTVAALLNCLSKKYTKIHFYTNFPPLPLKPQCRKTTAGNLSNENDLNQSGRQAGKIYGVSHEKISQIVLNSGGDGTSITRDGHKEQSQDHGQWSCGMVSMEIQRVQLFSPDVY